MNVVSNICFSVGIWLIINGLVQELSLLYPIGCFMIIEGLRIVNKNH